MLVLYGVVEAGEEYGAAGQEAGQSVTGCSWGLLHGVGAMGHVCTGEGGPEDSTFFF
jgi:hypothetical protein